MQGCEIRLAALAELDASALPSEFPLFKFGDNPTSKGVFKLDEAGAKSVMDAYKQHGVDLHFDYEHDQRNAAAWFAPEVRADGLWAANIRWTPRAAELLKGREYRFASPTFAIDGDKRITRLVNVALTNLPATENAPALVAASERAVSQKEQVMNLQTIIGLKDDASEDAVTERVISLANLERRLLDATGKETIADAMIVVLSAKDATVENVQLKKSLHDWEERHSRELEADKARQIESVIQGAILERRVSLKDTDRLERWRKYGEDFGVDHLKKLVAERDPAPVRLYQAPKPTNTLKAQLAAIEQYKKANPGTSSGEAYVALSASNPALFGDDSSAIAVEE